jgi:cytochrome c peroxidase
MIKSVLFLIGINFIIIFFSCQFKEVDNKKDAEIEIGKHLFFDRRLSYNQTKSCSSCHDPKFAFTDGYKRSLGIYADLHQRNAQPLFNLNYLKYFTAADSGLHSVLQQMNNPLFNIHPAEMGVKGYEEEILTRFKKDAYYKNEFKKVDKEISFQNIKELISVFVGTIKSSNSNYDKFLSGDTNALNANEKRGMILFNSKQLNCSSCHGGFNFSTPSITNEKGDTLFYFNTGLYNIDGQNAYPAYDQGLFYLTQNKNDRGKFRVPTLRNLAFTAPYLHDGSAATLTEVIDNYANGGRTILQGEYKGNGTKNLYKHPLIKGFEITDVDKKNLIAFLLSLSDSNFIKNSQYQNPFTEDETKKK